MENTMIYHEYTDRMSYPHTEKIRYDHHDNFTTRGKHQLYSDSLLSISRQAEANIDRAREKMMLIDPCRAYGLEHWHPENPKWGKESDIEIREDAEWPRWETERTIFSTEDERRQAKPGGDDIHMLKDGTVNRLCYLCTTIEEHKLHLLRRGQQFKAKKKRKPRIQFIPPPPTTAVKENVPEEKNEILYKFEVKTGNAPNAATSANVTVKMKGDKGIMRPRPLKKKIGVNFIFGRGTTETFYIKGPDIGDIKLIAMEHDGLEKRHAWFLEYVDVTNMKTEEVWRFPFKNWISLFHGDSTLKKVLQGRKLESVDTTAELEVSVITGEMEGAGTSSNVHITVYGKKGVSRKMPLKSKSKGCFKQGCKDKFYVDVKHNILPITKIRIEHDNTGSNPDWFLEKVTIHDPDRNKDYKFPCGRWLALERHDGKTFADLYPFSGKLADTKHGKKKASGPTIKYEVTVLTGTERFAGTDATVFLQLFGTRGKSTEVELNDIENQNPFEQGQTDEFKVRAEDVGTIKRITVRHDNSGLGAGWLLEKMTIRKFFNAAEVRERLQEMGKEIDETLAKRASEVGVDLDRPDSRHEGSSRYDSRGRKSRGSSHDNSSDDDHKSHRHRRGKYAHDSDSDQSRKSRRSISWKNQQSDESDEVVNVLTQKYRKGSSGSRKRRDSHSDDSRKRRGSNRRRDVSNHSDGYHRKGRYDSDDDDHYHKERSRGKDKKKKGYNRDDSEDSDERATRNKMRRNRKGYNRDDSDESDSDTYVIGRIGKQKKKKAKQKKKSRYSSDSESDSDSSSGEGHRKQRKHKNRRKKSNCETESDSETESESSSSSTENRKRRGSKRWSLSSDESERFPASKVWKDNRIPYYDEYLFVCKRWLALDEEDGKIEREFKPKTVTTFYKVRD